MAALFDNTWNPSTWMADTSPYIQTRHLCNLVIPGTHDSGSYGITDNSIIEDESDIPLAQFLKDLKDLYNTSSLLRKIIFPVFKAWSLTTNCTLRQQLGAGIRYLDLRVIKRDGNYYFCHMLEGENVDVGIRDVAEFIEANPKEIVILDFHCLYNIGVTDRGLVDKLIKAFGAKIAPNSMNPNNSVGDFWRDGYQVIVCWPLETLGVPFWMNQVHSNWVKEQTPDGVKIEVLRDLHERLENKELSDMLFVSQALISPNEDLILGFIYSELEKAKRSNPPPIEVLILDRAQEIVKQHIHEQYFVLEHPSIPVSIRSLARQCEPNVQALIDDRDVFQNIILVDWFNDIQDFSKRLNTVNLEYHDRHKKDD